MSSTPEGTSASTSSTPAAEEESVAETEPTSRAWEKLQVSISPLTHEKVYVVTPVPTSAAKEEELLGTRVERSYSVVTSVDGHRQARQLISDPQESTRD